MGRTLAAGRSSLSLSDIRHSRKRNNIKKKKERDKEGHYIKYSIQQEETTLTCASNSGTPRYMKQVLINLNGDIDYNMIAVIFNTPLSEVERSFRQKKSIK